MHEKSDTAIIVPTIKEQILSYFEKRLDQGRVSLGNREEYFNDDDRYLRSDWMTQVTTAVIHHTHMSPRTSLSKLNAMGLLRLYAPVYKNSKAFQENGKLMPISSGHFFQGRQVFWGYHWLVPNDSKTTGVHILKNAYLGFHAGNYLVNCKSIGIAVDDDLTDKPPHSGVIDEINRILGFYPNIKDIIGHNQVSGREGIVCPGGLWNEWKDKLVPVLQRGG